MSRSTSPNARNVVVFLCDQLRRDYLSLYGGRGVPTPNLDRLASMGVVFDRAISQSPVCGPSRATMMTGRYPSDHGVWTNDVPFREGLEYLPQRMNARGYRTGAFGKLHHTPGRDTKGFRVHHAFEEGRLGDDDDYLKWLRTRHPEAERFNHADQRFLFEDEDYYEHWIASRAIDFIGATNADAASDDPFFAWVSFQGPHGPYDPPKSVAGTCDAALLPPVTDRDAQSFVSPTLASRSARMSDDFRGEDSLNRLRVAYAEMIVFIDRQIGRVLSALEQSGRLAHTTFLFSADHGEMLGDHGLDEKGPFPYRQHLEVPLLVANHPGITAGTRSDALAGTIDLPGTALDVAGDPAPLGQSRSLLGPASNADSPWRSVNFSEFGDALKLVEDAEFRFCGYPFTDDLFLYRPADDPEMTRNLADDPGYAPVVRRMLRHALDFQIVAKGAAIEAHDLVAGQQAGLAEKDPTYADTMPIAFALSRRLVGLLEKAGLDATYNRAFEGRVPTCMYELPYWETP